MHPSNDITANIDPLEEIAHRVAQDLDPHVAFNFREDPYRNAPRPPNATHDMRYALCHLLRRALKANGLGHLSPPYPVIIFVRKEMPFSESSYSESHIV